MWNPVNKTELFELLNATHNNHAEIKILSRALENSDTLKAVIVHIPWAEVTVLRKSLKVVFLRPSNPFVIWENLWNMVAKFISFVSQSPDWIKNSWAAFDVESIWRKIFEVCLLCCDRIKSIYRPLKINL